MLAFIVLFEQNGKCHLYFLIKKFGVKRVVRLSHCTDDKCVIIAYKIQLHVTALCFSKIIPKT